MQRVNFFLFLRDAVMLDMENVTMQLGNEMWAVIERRDRTYGVRKYLPSRGRA